VVALAVAVGVWGCGGKRRGLRVVYVGRRTDRQIQLISESASMAFSVRPNEGLLEMRTERP